MRIKLNQNVNRLTKLNRPDINNVIFTWVISRKDLFYLDLTIDMKLSVNYSSGHNVTDCVYKDSADISWVWDVSVHSIED